MLRLLLGLLAAFGATAGFAADLQVSPVRITLDEQSPNAVMTLINRGNTDTLLQLNVVGWNQDANGDVLTPTREVLANPGIFLLKAGDQQVARFALRVAPDIKERSYRVVVQEVPRQHVSNGLATVLRLLVPVFVLTPNPNPAIEWGARPVAGGVDIIVHNIGNIHVQVKTIKLSGGLSVSKTVNMYVLPGATGVARIQTPKAVVPGTQFQLAADSDQIGFSASVRVGASQGVPGHP